METDRMNRENDVSSCINNFNSIADNLQTGMDYCSESCLKNENDISSIEDQLEEMSFVPSQNRDDDCYGTYL